MVLPLTLCLSGTHMWCSVVSVGTFENHIWYSQYYSYKAVSEYLDITKHSKEAGLFISPPHFGQEPKRGQGFVLFGHSYQLGTSRRYGQST